jgi:hypothetical protein
MVAYALTRGWTSEDCQWLRAHVVRPA